MRPFRAALHVTLALGVAGLAGTQLALARLLERESSAVPSAAQGEPELAAAGAPAADAPAAPAAPDATALAAALGFGALDVTVLRDGAPVSGAEVRVYVRDGSEPAAPWRQAGSTSTAPDGVASWPALPGRYLVAVRAPGLAPAHAFAERPRGAARTRVQVALLPAVEVSGRVLARRGGEPVPLAAVSLTPAARDAALLLPPEERAHATADTAGRFRLAVAPGSHLLEASAAGFTRARRTVLAPHAAVEVALSAAAVVEGFVRRSDGTPAAGAEVTLVGGAELVHASVGTSGGFAAEVTPGTYTVTAHDERAAGAWRSPVTVGAGGRARGVEIWLGLPGAIAGVVTGEDGMPVPGASLTVSPHDAPGQLARGAADAGGRFEVEGLGPGRYDVAVAADGWSPETRTGVALLPGERAELTVVMQRCGSVQGTVRDDGGQPAAGVLVRARPAREGRLVETRTGSDGSFELTGLRPDSFDLVAVPEGAEGGASAKVRVAPGEVTRTSLTLARTGFVEGLVTRRDRAPVERAFVVLVPLRYPAAGGPPVRAEVDASGRYAVQVPAGEYRAYASFSEGANVLPRGPVVRVSPGATSQVDLVVGAEGGPALVQVVEPSGGPSPAALVVVTADDDLRTAGTGATDEEGFARIDLEERSELLVRAVRGGRMAGPVPLAPSGPTVLTLPAGASLTGQVRAEGGAAPAGFTVELAVLGDDVSTVSTLLGGAAARVAGGPTAPRRIAFAGDRFEVPDAPSGLVRVLARTTQGRTSQIELRLAPGEQRHLELILPGDGVLTGRAVDARTHAPVAGASVALVLEGRASARPDAAAGPDGHFRIAGLGPGRRTVRLTAPGYTAVQREIDPAGDRNGDLGDVALSRALEGAAAAR